MAKPKYMPDPRLLSRKPGECPRGYRYDAGLQKCVVDFSQGLPPVYEKFYQAVGEHGKKQYSQESEMLRSKVCGYLKKKIADEEQETQQYHNIELDIRKLYEPRLTSYVIPDIDIAALNTSQAGEVNSLKAIYNKFCVRY